MSAPFSKVRLVLGLGALLALGSPAPAQFFPTPCANCIRNVNSPTVQLRPFFHAQPAAGIQNNFPAVGAGAGYGAVGSIVSNNLPRQGISSLAPQVTGNGQGGPALAQQMSPGNMAGYTNPYLPGSPFGGYGSFNGMGGYGGYPGYPGYGGYPGYPGYNPYNPMGNPYYANPFSGVPFPSPFYNPYAGYQGFGFAPPNFAPMQFGNQGIGNPFPGPLPN